MIDAAQYRLVIGIFLCVVRGNRKRLCSELFFWNVIYLNFIFRLLILPKLIIICGDIECNPGPPSTGPHQKMPEYCHINLRSLTADCDTTAGTNKFSEFETFVATYGFDIVGITETWLDASIDNDIIHLNNYLPPLRRDRNRNGGGICVYISDSFPAKRVPYLEPANIEIICIECQLSRQKHLLCITYRPPNFDTIEFLSGIDSILAHQTEYSDIIFMGDFNGKHEDFCATDITTGDGRELKAYFDSKDFIQLIGEPTRFQNNHMSCLDLIFTNNPITVRNPNVYPQINNCDHCPISVGIFLDNTKYNSYKRMVWDFKRGDFDKLRNILYNCRWDSVFTKTCINDKALEFMYIFEKVSEACVPHYETTIRPNNKPYITTEIKKLIRRRDRLYHLYKSTKTQLARDNYTHARNFVVSKIRESLNYFEARQLTALNMPKTNPKLYWKTLKMKYNMKTKPIIPPLICNNGIIIDPSRKAELFNNLFVSQTILDDKDKTLPGNYPSVLASISHITITEYDTYKILSNLDPSKATGADGIGNKLLKESAAAICAPLSKLFQQSMNTGIFPSSWKFASVTALHKKGSAHECNNYRPISLLPCISKVFEKLVFNNMYAYLINHKLISSHQSGFRPGDSTVRQLVSICHKINQSLDNGDEVLSVFLDFRKAFDKVWHKGLLFKLNKIGIKGNLLKWIEHYLYKRQQCVVIQGHRSTYRQIFAGIPQGSVLGPLLFLIYINDICNGLKSMVQLYADDTSLFQIVRNRNIISAVNQMNLDLAIIKRWSDQWLVEVSTEKSVFMLISKKSIPTRTLPIVYGTDTLDKVEHHKHKIILVVPHRTGLHYSDQTNQYDDYS